VLVDANILIYAVDASSPYHPRARTWLQDALNGHRRVGIPWQSYWAFLRIATNPRAFVNPLAPAEAWRLIEAWLDAPATWLPEPGPSHRVILHRLITDAAVHGPLVSDAVLAALCIEHGLAIVSNDSDFARFREVRWVNPLA